MHKKTGLFILALLCFTSTVMSQDKNKFPAITLRTNPFSWLENDGNIMLGAGIHFSPRIAISVEPGWVLYTLYDIGDGSNPANGIKLRSDVRYFLREFVPLGKNKFIPFAALEFHYKNIAISKREDFGINCINGNCDYFQQADYTMQKKEIGGLVKLGAIFPLSKSGRFNGEFFVGLGARHQKFSYKNLPQGGSMVNIPTDPASEFPYISLNDRANSPTLLLSTGIKFSCFLRP